MASATSTSESIPASVDDLFSQQPDHVKQIGLAMHALLSTTDIVSDNVIEPASLNWNVEQKTQFKQFVSQFRALPAAQQNHAPLLLKWMARTEYGLSEFQAAERDFHQLAELNQDPSEKAHAFYQAYRAALERPHLGDAFKELQAAWILQPDRYAPIPLDQFDPDRIVAHDALGLTFRCVAKKNQSQVLVRTVDSSLLDRGLAMVFQDLKILSDLQHPGLTPILGVAHATAACPSPIIVSGYAEWISLEQYVQRYGPLSAKDSMMVGRLAVEAMQAAHQAGVLHRAICPNHLLLNKSPEGWQVRLIQFGMALREDMLSLSAKNPAQLMRTAQGRWLAHCLDYASPEQQGQIAQELKPSCDVYSWAKTICFAAFGTPHPAAQHWQKLKPEWAELLNQCCQREPQHRPADFSVVLEQMPIWSSAPEASIPLTAPLPVGAAQVTTPKLASGMPVRRRLTPIEELKLRIRQLTIFYGLIALGVVAVAGLIYFIFFYKPFTPPLKIVPVAGRLMLDGQGVAQAKLVFKHENPELPDAKATTNDEGFFVLSTLLPNDGAYPGKYRVLVTKADPEKPRVIPGLPSGDPNNPTMRPNPFAGFSEVHSNYGNLNLTPLRSIQIPDEGHHQLILHLNLLGR